MAGSKISELDLQSDIPADPDRTWIAIVVDGVTMRISLSKIIAAAKN